ncbi:MAG TPA: DUF2799 domain-containing protein [Burkholderiales bacterium]|jgi:hypothetical protein|nr:DUF2799 domain-containing protein [Burkholderiales bacterium]
MKNLVILATVVLAGCAADCGPDWREIGLRDGSLGAGSQAERYAARCNTTVDTAAYEQGYREGFAMRPRVPYP